MKIFIINQCSTNKGDRAVLLFILRSLIKNGITNIVISTSEVSYWEGKLEVDTSAANIKFVPYGWSLSNRYFIRMGLINRILTRIWNGIYKRFIFPKVRDLVLKEQGGNRLRRFCNRDFFTELEKSDLVISTGGHHFTTIIAKDAIYPQTFDAAVVVGMKKPLVLWSQSLGPFEYHDRVNKDLMVKIISSAKAIYTRDIGSEPQIEELIGTKATQLKYAPESVFGLFGLCGELKQPSQREKILGVSVYATNKKTSDSAVRYSTALAEVVTHALKVGYDVRFFPMEMRGDDLHIINMIVAKCPKEFRSKCQIINSYPQTLEHVRLISDCRMFIAHKTHSVIFSLITGTPVLALAYHKKTRDFMVDYLLQDYCIDDNVMTPEIIIQLFKKLESTVDPVHLQIINKSKELRNKVDTAFAEFIKTTSVEFEG